MARQETGSGGAFRPMFGDMELSPEHKLAGILTPLFALRGANDLGVGDVAALRELVNWAADAGLGWYSFFQ